MKELETLLNSLIKMGWKPWGFEVNFCKGTIYKIRFQKDSGQVMHLGGMRELVSLESGLWQFCEKNGLLHEYYNGRSNIHPYKCYWTTTYEYRLLESALIPEDKLGQFLLDNIKVEGNSK